MSTHTVHTTTKLRTNATLYITHTRVLTVDRYIRTLTHAGPAWHTTTRTRTCFGLYLSIYPYRVPPTYLSICL